WGTDINSQVLSQARQGSYSAWSLRGLDQATLAEYFRSEPHSHAQNYRLIPEIRAAVQFETFNLAQGQAWLREPLDLILCRNVFIYFAPGAIAQALRTFSQALRPGGYLLTGHAELYNQRLSGLSPRLFPESLVYQREPQSLTLSPPQQTSSSLGVTPPIQANPPSLVQRATARPTNTAPPLEPFTSQTLPILDARSAPLQPKPAEPLPANPHFRQAQVALAQKNYPAARHHLQQVLTDDPQHFVAHSLQAQLEANLGNHALAQQWCEAALKIQPLSVAIYYLLAQIAAETGHTEKAKRWLKKIIYLEPEAIAAYYELRLIYQQEYYQPENHRKAQEQPDNQHQRVQKLDAIILKLLTDLSPDLYLDAPLNMTVAQLRALLS
ncbi:MAG: CheR family methyltransferase, partial [Spirulinaceae cyanobacterium]